MFTWNIAKSAEAMCSRWAVKRLCKFLLKKKLGKFILGDIDLDQLDVQLRAGTIQLFDLALNVDYINQKFGNAACLLKEGSLGSLMVTLPWKDGGCQVTVDELEVVLVPQRVKNSKEKHELCSCDNNNDNCFHHVPRTRNAETMNCGVTDAVDVHEGVKAIAKMVKWLLTSFHVRIKKLIVAIDPTLEEEKGKRFDRMLVLRIGEVESGTHISEDISSSSYTKLRNILGLNGLTNFVRFQGAVLELLHVDGLDPQTSPELFNQSNLGEWVSGYCSSGTMATIIAGEKGGFSGNLKLSIPWENGSLDIRKVDADLHVEPLELRLQPITIKCFIFMWDLFQDIGEQCEDPAARGLLSPRSCLLSSDKGGLNNEDCSIEKESVNALLSESNLISDWVSKDQNDNNEEEPDFGASVNQFFECFDGLRNSQSALGNSGVWNWTCSVFGAITAASNLASGSLHVISEQQHIETNFKATIGKISVLFSFIDESEIQISKLKNEKVDPECFVRCICAQFIDLCLVFQVCPQEMNFDLTVHDMHLIDHLFSEDELYRLEVCDRKGNSESEIFSIQQLQNGVQSALRSFQESDKDHVLDHHSDCSVNISMSTPVSHKCIHKMNGKYVCTKDTGVSLLKTSGLTHCHVKVNSGSTGGLLLGPTSISLKLPPLVFWVNFDLISMVIDFVNEMERSIEKTTIRSSLISDSESRSLEFSPLGSAEKISHQRAMIASKKRFDCDIFIPNARIILCFPLRGDKDFRSYSTCNQFIAFDFVSSTIGGKNDKPVYPESVTSSIVRHGVDTSCSLHLYLGSFNLFSVAMKFDDRIRNGTNIRQEPNFFVEKVVSAVNGNGHLPPISLFWQEVPVSCPWILKKAKLLASSEENARSTDKFDGKGFEFASVTTVKDRVGFDAHFQHEILSSSAFFLHVRFPIVTINLSKALYENISGLLNQVIENFVCVVSNPIGKPEEHPASQSSFLLESNSLTVALAIEPVPDTKNSTPKELPGAWLSLTLQLDRFDLLSVTNIGGITSANFLWASHGQGNLWGSVTKDLYREFLLISCNDSTMGRGDGEGSNVLSSRSSGSDIINLWDPESNHNFSSICVRCTTFIAIGGRLDWFDVIFSFFSPPSSEFDISNEKNLDKIHGSSLILNLVDVGLAYEPFFQKCIAAESRDPKYSKINLTEYKSEPYVSCLLACSSLKLSHTSVVEEYKIKLCDLGFLLSSVTERKPIDVMYNTEYLSETGYVKVAQEAHVEALIRTNCDNGHAWELECSESHIVVNTCHDTTMGLIRLAAQLQKLFAPDMKEYIVHLENRWNNTQHAPENSDERTLGSQFAKSVSQTPTSNLDNESKIGNLMSEICEDVFQLDVNTDGQANFFRSDLLMSPTNSLREEYPKCLSVGLPRANTVSSIGVGAHVTAHLEEQIPELIEEYFMSDLRPLSQFAFERQSSNANYRTNNAVAEGHIGNGRWYDNNSLSILENHASKVNQLANVDQFKKVEATSSSSDYENYEVEKAEGCIIVKNMNVIWKMYGGSEWSNFKNTLPPSATRTSGRDTTVCFELSLTGIELDYNFYPAGKVSASRLSFTIREFCLNDRSHHAPWKLVLGYYQSKKHPRKVSSKALKLNLEAFKPDPSIPLEENRLRIALLPMRLHLHQSQLNFLINFFGENNASHVTSPSFSGDEFGEQQEKNVNLRGSSISMEAFLTYFQKVNIWALLIRVDYSPHRVDFTALRGGKYVELINIVPWKDIELQLKHVQGVGLYGWNSVCETIFGEWLEDISQNQIHKLLIGLPPIKSLVAVGSGTAKLVSLPLKNYKKDHRLLKGMQRGAFAFLKSISLEAIGIGVHLAAGAHNILLQAEYILTTIPPSVPWPVESRVATNVRSNQPMDAQQGIHQACQSISDGLGKSASALVQTPLKKFQRGAGVGSALATAAQATPAAVIAPASAAAHAVHCALLGFRNSLDPDRKRESVEKYLGRTPHKDS